MQKKTKKKKKMHDDCKLSFLPQNIPLLRVMFHVTFKHSWNKERPQRQLCVCGGEKVILDRVSG